MGGHDLKSIPLVQLYDQVAFVSQDNYLFDGTVRENIRMDRRDATNVEVEAAAHAAGCDSFVFTLEKGYDTMVGGGDTHDELIKEDGIYADFDGGKKETAGWKL